MLSTSNKKLLSFKLKLCFRVSNNDILNDGFVIMKNKLFTGKLESSSSSFYSLEIVFFFLFIEFLSLFCSLYRDVIK